MSLNYLYPEFEVLRHPRCTKCRLCEKECSNKVHHYDATLKVMVADDEKCVNCHRCVSICPVKALKIARTNCTYRDDDNWTNQTIKEIYKQAESGGILLSSMGSPKRMPIYWDRLLINASQVTNPPIDPLREPMETRVFLGKKPNAIVRDAAGCIDTSNLAPQLELSMPVMFAAMSYGAISYNAHKSLAMAAQRLGIYYNTGEGGLHEDFYAYGDNTIVQVASGRFGVHERYLNAGAAIEVKMGQGAKPGIGGHLPGTKSIGDVSRTRMIPEGSDAISPAPHHDIYSIEDLRQLVYSLKEATNYTVPIIVKVAAVRTSLPSTGSAAARGLRRHASATMSAFPSSLPSQHATSVCARRASATMSPSSSAEASARRPMSSRRLRSALTPAMSPRRRSWRSAVTSAAAARSAAATGASPRRTLRSSSV